jgi:uncharacterized membrane protein YkvA (DUF1232 family)
MAGNPVYRSRFFALLQQRAKRILKDPEALARLAQKAEDKAAGSGAGPLAGVADELKALLRLIRAYARGDYRKVSWQSMAMVVGAVLYVVSPIDVIPDFLFGGGLVDDASVLVFAYRKVHKEIEEFLEWERANAPGPPELEPPAAPSSCQP